MEQPHTAVGEATPTPVPEHTPPPPSRRRRARSQRLLVTLLGDYRSTSRGPLPSAGLVRALEEFEIAPANARAALSRLTQRGMLERTKEGRRTRYALTARAQRLLDRGAARIFALGEDGDGWDGTWTVVVFSVPHEDSDLRHLLRRRLRWLSFTPLYDATWVAPRDLVGVAREQLADLDVADAVVLRSDDVQLLSGGHARLKGAWDLTQLAERYRRYATEHRALADRARRGVVPPEEALVGRTEMVDAWRALVRDDPDLPAPFLPDDFPRARARELFLATYRALATPAQERFEALVREP